MKFPTEFPTLKTERLVLKEHDVADAKQLFAFQSVKNNFPHADLKIFRSVVEAEDRIQYWKEGFRSKSMISFSIQLDGVEIGMSGLWNFEEEYERAEVSFHMYPEYRGNGYMKEALIRIAEFGIFEMELDDIRAFTRPENNESKLVLEGAGFEYQGDIKDYWYDEHDPPEMSVYRIRANRLR